MNHPAPTVHQQRAIDAIMDFVRGDNDCFILRGSAGTGKTTLIAHLLLLLREHYHLHCTSFELTEVQRQARGSAILEQAKAIRNAIAEQKFNAFDISGQPPGIIGVTAAEGIRQVLTSYQRPAHQSRGQGSSVMVTYSNARALDHNRAVREQLWGNYQLPVQQGEQLLVNKNAPLHGLSNGDLVKVNRVLAATESRRIILRGVSEPVLLSFARMELVYRGFDGQKMYIECLMLENLLASRERSPTALELRALLVDFRQRHRGLKPKTAEFQLALREDPWFNALRVKYGYAMTCHKAREAVRE
ncbi:hypothetical protein [Endozoicomonas sp. ONNA2]|uniref:hypothetical protein n=1 Tax=Endozoicomonas sp. ONNA2 TaxID=2828741 RepID=UPI002148160C|nr:hypothetical protein [Endozoicomonas sp. ONNA2]